MACRANASNLTDCLISTQAQIPFRLLDPLEAEALSSARADRLERELEEARNEAARHARQAARAEAALARARINEDDARLCAVCLDAPKDAALVPCGHRTCRSCAKALRRRKLCLLYTSPSPRDS